MDLYSVALGKLNELTVNGCLYCTRDKLTPCAITYHVTTMHSFPPNASKHPEHRTIFQLCIRPSGTYYPLDISSFIQHQDAIICHFVLFPILPEPPVQNPILIPPGNSLSGLVQARQLVGSSLQPSVDSLEWAAPILPPGG